MPSVLLVLKCAYRQPHRHMDARTHARWYTRTGIPEGGSDLWLCSANQRTARSLGGTAAEPGAGPTLLKAVQRLVTDSRNNQ